MLWIYRQIVLHWISSSKSFGKFVNNCTKEIKESTSNSESKYVSTESNPAELQIWGISAIHSKNQYYGCKVHLGSQMNIIGLHEYKSRNKITLC